MKLKINPQSKFHEGVAVLHIQTLAFGEMADQWRFQPQAWDLPCCRLTGLKVSFVVKTPKRGESMAEVCWGGRAAIRTTGNGLRALHLPLPCPSGKYPADSLIKAVGKSGDTLLLLVLIRTFELQRHGF